MQHQPVSYGDEPICISDYVFVESQLFTKPAGYSYRHEYGYAFVERDELEERGKHDRSCSVQDCLTTTQAGLFGRHWRVRHILQ